ncbi:type II secretion system protein [Roseibacillus persicicus]|uniref:type II secretion system protein n=1 Tax=Roseibacillus persicicus TaxID=454148 RepID=UPI00398ABAFE
MTLPFPSPKTGQRGMTLIELTVVMLVMLGLIAVVFIGAGAWKRGSDRTMAILLIRSAQQGLRSHIQIEGYREATYPDLPDQLFGAEKYIANGTDRSTGLPKGVGELPDHPSASHSFDFVAGDGDIVPPIGTLYICTGGGGSVTELSYNPDPSSYTQW